MRQLVELEDEALDFRFNGGSPAYTDERFKDFLTRLPHFEEQMRRKHMTLQLLWEEYRREVFCLTQLPPLSPGASPRDYGVWFFSNKAL